MLTAAWSVKQVRDAEAPLLKRLPPDALMQRAAAGVAHECMRELRARRGSLRGARVVIAAGPGHNGGDGLYAAALLAERGMHVDVWLPFSRRHESAWAASWDAGIHACDATAAIDALVEADLVVDAVFGTDGRPGLPDDVATFAEACCELGVPVVSVDLPSGLAADSPLAPTSFDAACTVALGAAKVVHLCQPARGRCGRLAHVDLGLDLPRPVLRAFTLAEFVAALPIPDATSDKYSRGVVGLDTGSLEYVGAGTLSALGAVYSGAGMVRFVGPHAEPVRLELPNVVTSPGRVQVWVLGCGWGDDRANRGLVESHLADGVPAVLDADALRPDVLPEHLPSGCLLTPHAGELARLLECERVDVVASPVEHARRAAERYGATVLLKGATQYVVTPAGDATVAIGGPAWTAQAGSGDVLAGACGTMLAAGLDAREAALVAASLQAFAADRLAGPYPPQDVARSFPAVVASIMGR